MKNKEEYNNIIHQFITESNPKALSKTQKNIALVGQEQPGVVLADGRIVDGNRRFTCLRNIQEETGNTQYMNAVILERDITGNAKEIKMLELQLQHGVDKPVDYDPIDRLVGIYNDIVDKKLHSTADKRRAIAFNTGGSNLILFNYESIGSFISEIEKLVSKDTLLIFDEIHKIKAIGGVRATYALEIARKASYIIAMTGTPIPNSYTDIRNLLEILFHDEYDDFFGFSMQQLKNPEEQDIQVINKKLQPFFCRTTKKQLLVPEVLYGRI